MAKKITIKLTELAETHLNNLQYGMETQRPDGTATYSDAVNYTMENEALFEEITGDQILNWLMDNHREKYEEARKKYGLDKCVSQRINH
jgi:hypothetical protein